MRDLYAYRPSDELATALREFDKADDEFCARVFAYDKANPGNELLWKSVAFSTDTRVVGFRDGKPKDPPPEGLSRAQTRHELIPVRGKKGQPWREILEGFEGRPGCEPVWQRFNVPSFVVNLAQGSSAPTQHADCDGHGMIVFSAHDLAKEGPLSEHLTPMPLSEFYRIKEAMDERRPESGS